MDGGVPVFIGLILLIVLAMFITSIILVWISYLRTFKSNKALQLSKLNVLLVTVACIFGLFLINTVGGFGILGLPVIMLIVSILVAVRISKRTEKI
jgi:hypothetical protein